MHKVHVTVLYHKKLPEVFAAITDHHSFLSGGGLKCHLIKPGETQKNGLGAIRAVQTQKYTLIEEITTFKENESYDYVIKEIKPAVAFIHHNGWLEFKQVDNQVQVDWHSHYTFTQPFIGHIIGWFVKLKLKKVFLQRLNYIKK